MRKTIQHFGRWNNSYRYEVSNVYYTTNFFTFFIPKTLYRPQKRWPRTSKNLNSQLFEELVTFIEGPIFVSVEHSKIIK